MIPPLLLDNPGDPRQLVLDPRALDPKRGLIRARAIVPCRACNARGGHARPVNMHSIPSAPPWIPCTSCNGEGAYRAVVVLEGEPIGLAIGGNATPAIVVPPVDDPDRDDSKGIDRGAPELVCYVRVRR